MMRVVIGGCWCRQLDRHIHGGWAVVGYKGWRNRVEIGGWLGGLHSTIGLDGTNTRL